MNNLIFENMKKVAVFNGLINGEKYDNVADYNAKMNELLQNNIEVQASSSTSIKYVTDESIPTSGYVSTCTDCDCPDGVCTCAIADVDEDLSFYPYMEEDDPFYLDLLVDEDPLKSQEAYYEAQNVLAKCYANIVNTLNDETIDNDTRKDYLADIREIINNVKNDNNNNNMTLDSILNKRKSLNNDFEQYRLNYEAELAKSNREEDILNSAHNVISMFTAFYEDLENEVMTSIKEHEPAKCTCKTNDVKTECKEVKSQEEHDLLSILGRIFNDYGFSLIKK
jgi:hypothetical protein